MCIEAIDGGEDLAPLLGEQRLGGAANGLAVVDDEYLQALELRVAVHGQWTPSFKTQRRGQPQD